MLAPGESGGLVLLGKPGCHLCDDARAVLERVGAPFAEVDITSDDVLHAAYLERIPVVEVEGAEVSTLSFDAVAVRGALGAPTGFE